MSEQYRTWLHEGQHRVQKRKMLQLKGQEVEAWESEQENGLVKMFETQELAEGYINQLRPQPAPDQPPAVQ
jgi:hypothetical protein